MSIVRCLATLAAAVVVLLRIFPLLHHTSPPQRGVCVTVILGGVAGAVARGARVGARIMYIDAFSLLPSSSLMQHLVLLTRNAVLSYSPHPRVPSVAPSVAGVLSSIVLRRLPSSVAHRPLSSVVLCRLSSSIVCRPLSSVVLCRPSSSVVCRPLSSVVLCHPSSSVVRRPLSSVVLCRPSSSVVCHPLSSVVLCRPSSSVVRRPLSSVVLCRPSSSVVHCPLSSVVLCRPLSSVVRRPASPLSCPLGCSPHPAVAP